MVVSAGFKCSGTYPRVVTQPVNIRLASSMIAMNPRHVMGVGQLDAQAQESVALADREWTRPPGVSEEDVALAALVDVLRDLGGHADPDRVRLAALIVRRPVLALPFMDPDERAEWQRLIGDEAHPLPRNVVSLDQIRKGSADRAWADALNRIKGSGRLAVEEVSGMWSAERLEESGLPWIRGRAKTAVAVLREIEIAKAEQNLVAFVRELEHGKAGRSAS